MAVSAKICQQLAILDRGAAKLHGLLGPTCSVCSPHTTALSAAIPLISEEVSGLFSLNTCRNLYVLEAGKCLFCLLQFKNNVLSLFWEPLLETSKGSKVATVDCTVVHAYLNSLFHVLQHPPLDSLASNVSLFVALVC